MTDHVEIDHLTKYDAFRMNRAQAMNLEIWKSIQTSLILRRHPQKPYTVLCKSNANDNRQISRFVLPIYRRHISKTSHGLQNVKTINQRDIGTIFVISCRDIVLARLRCNDVSQSKTIYRHGIWLQPSSL